MTTAEKLKWCLDRLDECKGNKAALDAAKEAIEFAYNCASSKDCWDCPIRSLECDDIPNLFVNAIPDEAIEAHNELSK